MVTHIFRCFYIPKLPKQPAIQIHFGIKIARQNHSLLAMYRGDVIIHLRKKALQLFSKISSCHVSVSRMST